jgi:hypothetical protein
MTTDAGFGFAGWSLTFEANIFPAYPGIRMCGPVVYKFCTSLIEVGIQSEAELGVRNVQKWQ